MKRTKSRKTVKGWNNLLHGMTWFNYKDRAYEIYDTPLTDEVAREHIPQDEWVQDMYGALRKEGQPILAAMRGVFLALEERK